MFCWRTTQISYMCTCWCLETSSPVNQRCRLSWHLRRANKSMIGGRWMKQYTSGWKRLMGAHWKGWWKTDEMKRRCGLTWDWVINTGEMKGLYHRLFKAPLSCLWGRDADCEVVCVMMMTISVIMIIAVVPTVVYSI